MEKPVNVIEELYDVEDDARGKLFFEQKYPADKELEECSEKLADVKKRFITEISKNYK